MLKKQFYESPANRCHLLNIKGTVCASSGGSSINDMSVGDEINLNENFL